LRIELLQEPVKVFGTAAFSKLVETTSGFFVGLWAGKEWIAQGAEVESRASHQYWHLATALNLINLGCGLSRPLPSRVVDCGRHKVDEVVRNTFASLDRNFGGRYLYILVNLDRVAVYNLAAEMQSDLNSQGALA
jgi:hypothetical protein